MFANLVAYYLQSTPELAEKIGGEYFDGGILKTFDVLGKNTPSDVYQEAMEDACYLKDHGLERTIVKLYHLPIKDNLWPDAIKVEHHITIDYEIPLVSKFCNEMFEKSGFSLVNVNGNKFHYVGYSKDGKIPFILPMERMDISTYDIVFDSEYSEF